MIRNLRILSFGTVLTLGTVSAWPLGIRIADQGAQATARGNAFVATADDPSAIYYNPAGMTQLEGQNVLAGTYGITFGSEYTAPNGSRTKSKSEVQFTPQFFYTLTPKDLPLSFGLGFYTPYGFSLEWPDNATFRAQEGSINYLTLNPAIAWKIHPTLSIGAGITLNYAKGDLTQTILGLPFGGQSKFNGDGTDIGFNAGIMWRPFEKHSFGASYYSATRVNLKGTSSTSGADLQGIPSLSGPAEAKFQFPQHIVAGWSYRPTPKWNVEFNIDWTDWDSLEVVTVNQSPRPANGLAFNWQSSFFYEFGVTRYLADDWYVSAGYIYSENSVPDANFSPLIPDSERHIFSFGVGSKFKSVAWKLAYQFAYGPERNVTGYIPSFPGAPNANGRYEFFSHAIALSLGYGF